MHNHMGPSLVYSLEYQFLGKRITNSKSISKGALLLLLLLVGAAAAAGVELGNESTRSMQEKYTAKREVRIFRSILFLHLYVIVYKSGGYITFTESVGD